MIVVSSNWLIDVNIRVIKGNKKVEKIMYITGSFPRLGDGIGDAAGRLYEAIEDKSCIELVTSDIDRIRSYISEKRYQNVTYVSDWKWKSISYILKKIKDEKITKVLIEYAGNGYRRDLAISFLPFRIRLHNMLSKQKIVCHLRLHEFTMCRTARKIFTYPLVMFCHHMDTPSFVEFKNLSKKYGKKVIKSAIGSNINWLEDKKKFDKNPEDKIRLAFFGCIYPGKGIERVINIWSSLEEQYPGKYEFHFLGGFPQGLTNVFDNYQVNINALIEEKGLKGKIFFSGFLPEEEIEKQLDQIDIAVLPYEDGLTLRRGSFLAFLGRQVAVVTSEGDEEAQAMFNNSDGVRMCSTDTEMIDTIIELAKDHKYYEAGCNNSRFKENFEWKVISRRVFDSFTK